MIKAAIFDLDGTLLNRDESVKQFICNQYDRLIDFLGHIEKATYVNRFIELDMRGYVWKDRVYQQLVEEYSINGITPEQLLEDYKKEFKNYCIPFPHLTEMLVTLKENNLLLGMITNGYGQFQMDNINALAIKEYFNVILISEWEGIKKPDQEIFNRAIQSLGVEPGECVFVGDHPENDIRAAKKVGMIGIWKKNFQWEHVASDYTIEDLAELRVIVKQHKV
ncbi:HAD family hydrolase [Bacillus suaedae]|uniref:HAD family hydrolase n=1 Tax=Halalkalibacter suaedae TaxID=2822140 RepID=A0A940WVX0_9BACI|nr:HAD family hydrolase [Bacillus suaedae]MBP3951557.1 HAD family hydrolase [Bacillus suaedae]